MNSTNATRFATRALGPALLAVSTLLAGSASAGTLQVRDEEHLFSSEDRAALQQDATAYPFDVRVLTTGAHAADFDHYVGEQVGSPDMVVVGIDKEHRRTSVHFGTGSRIAPTEFHAIEQAGNASFKDGAFRAGVESILTRAKAAVGSSPAVGERSTTPAIPAAPADAPARQQSSGFPFGWVILGGLVLLGFIALRRAFANGMGNRYSPNLPPGGNFGPGYPPSGYGPGYGPGYGSGSGLGSGILGAGLGGLAGYELGKAMGEREEREHEREGGMFGGGSSDDRDRGDWDAGGDTSGWDDGSSGGDWGGGGSDGSDGGGGDGGW